MHGNDEACVVGVDGERIVREEVLTLLEAPQRPAQVPELWDGRAGDGYVRILRDELAAGLPLSHANPPRGTAYTPLAARREAAQS